MKKNGLKCLVGLGILGLVIVIVGCTSSKVDDEQAVRKEPVTFYITRHGTTLFNEKDLAQGWTDSPLTKGAIEEAERLGSSLKKQNIQFLEAYTSDLTRAKETGEYILMHNGQPELPLEIRKDFREISFGEYEGVTNEEMSNVVLKSLKYDSFEELAADSRGNLWVEFANGINQADTSKVAEDGQKIQKRFKDGLTKIAQKLENGGNVLIVSHGLAIGVLLADLSDDYTGEVIKNASMTKVVYEDGQFTVETIGDISHIEE